MFLNQNQKFIRLKLRTPDKDAVLPCGKVLHRAGTKVNPLEHMNLNRRIFFIDSREELQVEWLKEQLSNPLLE